MDEKQGGTSNRQMANVVLGVSVAGYLLTVPFAGTFAGGLLSSGFGAAVVGGCADWFAVTALFGKPLGIPYGTQILVRNRQEIVDTMITMVEKDLLTKDYLQRRLAAYDVGVWFEQEVLASILPRLVEGAAPDFLGKTLEPLVRTIVEDLPLSPFLADQLTWALEQGYDERLFDLALDEAELLVMHSAIRQELARLVAQTKKRYEATLTRRRLFNDLILRMDPDDLAAQLQRAARNYLATLRDGDHHWRKKARAYVRDWVLRLRNDPALQAQVEAWKKAQLGQIAWEALLQDLLKQVQSPDGQVPLAKSPWFRRTVRRVVRLVAALKEQSASPDKLDQLLKRIGEQWIDDKHSAIGELIRENINRFSDEALVELVQSKAGNDLQMIRINGSVVGGLVGMLIFLLTQLT
ncbi:DUF445 domain-containing protein [Heliophilum fasciatum]|uniref:Uncharacterized membrane-anchored protein YjiN (DUF445 family) n=1 Tax=Heliophilum fasciatum TaxID=35700 RepID=A0A4R2RVP1_9FIRM|nr:DUF445 domain-containing protein [Heliophilum fasciatum]MCW2276994.1 uncharacterized membrane-anchored protein YjiN (DUF445 family) [Heliophilum fasciatum]TCP68480.1 uncharacterized membrane-anchored protein YjiN (DUF445 family) [Heliophilum fasciatum]